MSCNSQKVEALKQKKNRHDQSQKLEQESSSKLLVDAIKKNTTIKDRVHR